MIVGAGMSIMTRRRETSIGEMRGWIWGGFLTYLIEEEDERERKGKERLKH